MNKIETTYTTRPSGALSGEIMVTPDKSISHRALIFSALAQGTSKIQNLLLGEDVLNTLRILNTLGVPTSVDADNLIPGMELNVEGLGLKGFQPPTAPLYCGNSGTTMRLMMGLLCGMNYSCGLTGDASLNKRPMRRVADPLTLMGGRFENIDPVSGRVVKLLNHSGLKGIDYISPVASAQVKSAVLLAALNATGETTVTEPSLSRNHTELMLKAMGADIQIEGLKIRLRPGKELKPIKISVPGDISSAAFFIVAALIVPDSSLTICDVNLNPTRTGLLDVLMDMGADIRISNRSERCGEPVGDISVRHSKLRNIRVGGAMIPRLIDEIPILALAAMFAEGDFVLSDAEELRVKESDRIHAVCHEFSKLGAYMIEKKDGMTIVGGRSPVVRDRNLSTYNDHRIAMTLAVAGLALREPLLLDEISCVQTSFPTFFELLETLRS